jgi:Putative MetA-pathway of phenol degradation
VLGFTYYFTNQSTQYQNGVDMHFDWGASQFLTKQFLVGAVGYVYRHGSKQGTDNPEHSRIHSSTCPELISLPRSFSDPTRMDRFNR